MDHPPYNRTRVPAEVQVLAGERKGHLWNDLDSFLPAEAQGCGRELATNITQKQLGEAAVHYTHSMGNKLRSQQLQTAFSTTLKKHVTSNELDAFEKRSKKKKKERKNFYRKHRSDRFLKKK